MPRITLIGEKQAIVENEFIYLGPNSDCGNCKLKNVCFNLTPYKLYKITKVRDKKHQCNIHEGSAIVVELEEIPIVAGIEKKISEGSTASIKNKNCKKIDCENYYICNNISIKENQKYKVYKIIGKIKCPIGYNLQKAELI